jgi:hypothetical protein
MPTKIVTLCVYFSVTQANTSKSQIRFSVKYKTLRLLTAAQEIDA